MNTTPEFIAGHNFSYQYGMVRFFNAYGRKTQFDGFSHGEEDSIEMNLTGGDTLYLVDPESSWSPTIDNLIEIALRNRTKDVKPHIEISPHAAVEMFLTGRITHENLNKAHHRVLSGECGYLNLELNIADSAETINCQVKNW